MTTTPTAATITRQGIILPSTGKTVTLSGLLNGRWIENEYQLNDHNWRDALKLFREIGTRVRMRYN